MTERTQELATRALNTDVLAYYRDPAGRTTPIRANGVKRYGGGYEASYIDFMQRSPMELRATPEQLTLAYFASVFAFQCIELRANKVASVPRQVYHRATGEDVGRENALQQALEWAYLHFQQQILYLWARSRSMYGETYLEPVTNFYEDLIGLRWLNPVNVTVQESSDGAIEYFEIWDGARQHRFAPSQIVFEKRPNPLNDVRGVGRLQQALDAINIERSVQQYVRAWFRNGAQPGIILAPKQGTITQMDQARLKETLADLSGAANAFEPLLTPVPMDITVVEAPKLTEQQVLKDDIRDEICNAIGVPRGLIDHNNARYQLSDNQQYAFLENEIIPECEAIGAAIDAQVMPRLAGGEALGFRFDLSNLQMRVDKQRAQVEIANLQLAAGAISLNEYRKALGMSELPNGNVFYLPAGSIQVPADQIGNLQSKPSYMPFMNPQSTIQQAADLAQSAGINVPTPPPASTNPASEAPAAVVAAADGMPVDAAGAAPVSASPVMPGKAVTVALKFGAQPDLVALQRRLETHYKDFGVEWNAPEDYHITLLHAPVATEEQTSALVETVKAAEMPDLNVALGSLHSFDNVGRHALHFRIRRNADLLALHGALYDDATAGGVGLSAYSAPERYTPHVTMGYAATRPPAQVFQGKLALTPASLLVWGGDGEVLYERPLGDVEGDVATEVGAEAGGAATEEQAADELKTWQRFAAKWGAKKAERFQCAHLPADAERRIKDALAGLPGDASRDAIKAVFEAAFKAEANVPAPGVTPQEAQVYWGRFDALMAEMGSTWLNTYQAAALARIRETLGEGGDLPDEAAIRQALEAQREGLIQEWVGDEANPGVLARVLMAGMAQGETMIERPRTTRKAEAGIGIDWNVLLKRALDVAKTYAYDLIRRIDETTVARVREAMTAWMGSGEPLSKLTTSLTEVFGDETRAASIAQTESTRMYFEGAKQRWEDNGVTKARWQTVNNSQVCSLCAPLHNVVADLDKGWPSGKGLVFPPAHPGCRCFSRPVVEV